MKFILSYTILAAFSFAAYADDMVITVDEMSSGTEVILDANAKDNSSEHQKPPAIEHDTENIPVRIEKKTKAVALKPKPKPQNNSPGTTFTVQLAAFRSRERAYAYHWKISKRIENTRIEVPTSKNKLYKVCCGTFPNYQEAKAKANKLKKRNINCFVSKISP